MKSEEFTEALEQIADLLSKMREASYYPWYVPLRNGETAEFIFHKPAEAKAVARLREEHEQLSDIENEGD